MINKATVKLNNSCFLNMLEKCNLCPRKCSVNRLDGELGFCNASSDVKIAKVAFITGRNHAFQVQMALELCFFHIAI